MISSTLLVSLLVAGMVAAQVPGQAPGGQKANPKVTLETSKGAIVIELYPDKAPKTVANFLQYVRSGHFDGTIFHRVIDGFMIQGGGFTTTMEQKQVGAPIQNEADNGLSNARGTIAMARTNVPNSATAQFFINTVNNKGLDHTGKNEQGWGYAVFGKVSAGMEAVDAIAKVPTGTKSGQRDVPVEAVIITKATAAE